MDIFRIICKLPKSVNQAEENWKVEKWGNKRDLPTKAKNRVIKVSVKYTKQKRYNDLFAGIWQCNNI